MNTEKGNISLNDVNTKYVRCLICGNVVAEYDAQEIDGQYVCLDCGDYVKCEDCGKLIPQDEAHWIEGIGDICESCCQNDFWYCDHCNSWHNTNSEKVNTRYGEEYWCDSCVNNDAFWCEHCEEWYDSDHFTHYNTAYNTTICSYCRDSYYSYCENCEELFRDDDVRNGLCDNCYDNCIIHEYHEFDKITQFYKTDTDATKPLYIGFELEIGKMDSMYDKLSVAEYIVSEYSNEQNRFHLEEDGSIDCYGFELISAPHTLQAHKDFKWEEIFRYIIQEGGRSHDCECCGLHVHFNKDCLTDKESHFLDDFINRYKPEFVKLARRESDYATFKPLTNPKIMGKKGGCNRYHVINWNRNEYHKKTFEFRLWRGTLKHSTFIATLELSQALVEFAKILTANELIKGTAFTNFIEYLKANYPQAHSYAISKIEQ